MCFDAAAMPWSMDGKSKPTTAQPIAIYGKNNKFKLTFIQIMNIDR